MDDQSPEGSVTRWLGPIQAGDPAAVQVLWERYFTRLVSLARQRLRAAPRARIVADEEDAALSAFDSFCQGAQRGRFPRLDDRDDLWRLLVVITRRKAAGLIERQFAQKRGGGQHSPRTPGHHSDSDFLAVIAGREPTPEFAATVAEQLERMLQALGDDELRQIAIWRLEGYDRDEIAERLGVARRTVARRLDLIRTLWAEFDPDPDPAA